MRLGIVLLADLAIRIGACGIEVPERDRAQAMHDTEIGEHPLDH